VVQERSVRPHFRDTGRRCRQRVHDDRRDHRARASA
jgi:transposase